MFCGGTRRPMQGEKPFMSQPRSIERRILSTTEQEVVDRSHLPQVEGLGRPALVELARTLRQYRDKARDVSRDRRRAHRGKAEPRGAGPAADEQGLVRKKEVFTAALKRVNRRLAREAQPDQGTLSRRALAMKRAGQKRHHPAPGRTAGQGMRPVESEAVRSTIAPSQVGSVSQANRDAQARRDG